MLKTPQMRTMVNSEFREQGALLCAFLACFLLQDPELKAMRRPCMTAMILLKGSQACNPLSAFGPGPTRAAIAAARPGTARLEAAGDAEGEGKSS